jgi:hypothetical protein
MRTATRMFLTLGAAAVCLLGSLLQAEAQTPARDVAASGRAESIPLLPIRRSIEEAEAEGAAFPTSVPDPLRTRIFAGYGGSAERKCVRVDNPMARRIGDFVIMGPMSLSIVINNVLSPLRWKGWWMSAHDPTLQRNGMLIRGARLRADGVGPDSLRHVQLNYDHVNVGRTPVAQFRHPVEIALADMHQSPIYFYPSDGEWLLIVTSGTDWGCYVTEHRRPT